MDNNTSKNPASFNEIVFWLCVLTALITVFILLIDTIKPFIYGAILAYLFIPLSNKLQKNGISKTVAIIMIVSFMASIIFFFLLFFLPYFLAQLKTFVLALPNLVEGAIKIIASLFNQLGIEEYNTVDKIKTLSQHIAKNNLKIIKDVFESVIISQGLLLTILSYAVLCPLIAVYILYDYKNIGKAFIKIIPLKRQGFAQTLISEINEKIYAFIGAQLAIAFIMIVFYVIALSLIGLDYAIIIGIISGAVIFIPYLGFIIGFILSTGFAIIQFWHEPFYISFVVAIFLIGQFIEANILTPKIMSKKLSLSPLYILFLIIFFTSIFGIVGAIIAIPLGAILNIIFNHLLFYYKASDFYNKNPFSSSKK